jgi:outer membrane murein-binding lipoprotein Lpp
MIKWLGLLLLALAVAGCSIQGNALIPGGPYGTKTPEKYHQDVQKLHGDIDKLDAKLDQAEENWNTRTNREILP